MINLITIPYSSAILNLTYDKDQYYFGPFAKDKAPPGLCRLDEQPFGTIGQDSNGNIRIGVPPVSSPNSGKALLLEDVRGLTNDTNFHKLCLYMATKESGCRLNLPAVQFNLHGPITSAYGLYSPNSMSFSAESGIKYVGAANPANLPCSYPNILYQYTLYDRVYHNNYQSALAAGLSVHWSIFYTMLYQHTPSHARTFLKDSSQRGGDAAYASCKYLNKDIVLKHTHGAQNVSI